MIPGNSVFSPKQNAGDFFIRRFIERLAATYSRGSYTTTTIGKTVFDGRVRNGNGSDHSFMATKLLARVQPCKFIKIVSEVVRRFSENYTQGHYKAHTIRELKRYSFVVSANLHSRLRLKEKAIKPH